MQRKLLEYPLGTRRDSPLNGEQSPAFNPTRRESPVQSRNGLGRRLPFSFPGKAPLPSPNHTRKGDMPHMFQGQKTLTVDEAAEMLQSTPFTVRRLVKDGYLPHLRFGHALHLLEAGVLAERKRLDAQFAVAMARLAELEEAGTE